MTWEGLTPPYRERFCPDCGVSMDLHYSEDDCEGADQRARVIESFPFRLTPRPESVK